ncbi:MAG: hypothetical protein ABIF85_00265 [Nanoarchaeota archaeon]|nr:hypothetical protein [Nanoarchaeota archaeon]MBU4300197.1 hypothetical protein [Nanoarchaeota archaeon]MBU4452071.1 hypothetical protein [Nanoarchaeota archaeon]MCG2724452.1 hypothetical protein [archaeon]
MAKEKADVKNEEFMEHAKKDAKMAMDMAKAKFREAENAVDEAIHKDPVHAAMIAAGIGAAIGAAVTLAVMRRKKKD